jgi:hypothetical protein
LPEALAPLVPTHGLYAAGGGLMSSPWRVVVDLDAGTIYGGESEKPNTPSLGKMDTEATKPLAAADRDRLKQLGLDAWAEPPPGGPPSPPIADYDEILIVANGDDVFFLEGYGPIRRPVAARALEELRAAAGL